MNTTAISIFLGVVMFALAVIIKTGWRPPSQSKIPWGWIGAGVGMLLVAAFFLRGCNRSKTTPLSTPTIAPASVRQVVQMPDQTTPCTIDIAEIRDIYTDGEPIWILPPGWSESKKIYYSGKGHLVVQGGDIHSGVWKFWSGDTNKVVLIRIFTLR